MPISFITFTDKRSVYQANAGNPSKMISERRHVDKLQLIKIKTYRALAPVSGGVSGSSPGFLSPINYPSFRHLTKYLPGNGNKSNKDQ